jgi:hypothetical protein
MTSVGLAPARIRCHSTGIEQGVVGPRTKDPGRRTQDIRRAGVSVIVGSRAGAASSGRYGFLATAVGIRETGPDGHTPEHGL